MIKIRERDDRHVVERRIRWWSRISWIGVFYFAAVFIIMATQEKKSRLGCWGDKNQLIEIPGVYTKRRKCLVLINYAGKSWFILHFSKVVTNLEYLGATKELKKIYYRFFYRLEWCRKAKRKRKQTKP